MNDKIKKKIIGDLVDKFERSSAFKKDESPKRRILIRLYDNGKNDFPLYDIEQNEKRIEINRAVKELNNLGLLSFEWMEGERDHIISKVWLNYEKISDAYKYLGRKPKKDEIDDICISISNAIDNTGAEWAKKFLYDVYNEIYNKKRIGNSLPSDPKERNEFLKCICFISNIKDKEFLERSFSLHCFHDSKSFERNYRSRLLSVLRKYIDMGQDSKDEDLLRQAGILKYPEQIEFCGDLFLINEHSKMDFSCLKYGASIFADEINEYNIKIPQNVRCIITIENKANYIDYIYKCKNKDTLAVFHGGQYSQSKKIFFEKLSDSIGSECVWLHWGDIDYGGFNMLARLRREININIQPYCMGIPELDKYQQFCSSFNDEYAERLKTLLSYNELSDCYTCIDYMIKKKIRLEQEALL